MRRPLRQGWELRLSYRILAVADVHYSGRRTRRAVRRLLSGDSFDLIVLCGDLSRRGSIADVYWCARAFTDHTSTPVLAVPGNHDLWSVKGRETAREKLYSFARACKLAGAHPLCFRPYVCCEVAVVGCCGWYDGSLHGGLSEADSSHMYLITEMSDEEMLRWQLELLRRQLDQVPSRAEVIFTTHMIPTSKLIDYSSPAQRKAARYMGSRRLLELAASSGATLYICGHNHEGPQYARDMGVDVYNAAPAPLLIEKESSWAGRALPQRL